MPTLDDVRLRLGRAEAYADSLRAEVVAWRTTDPQPHRIVAQQEAGNQFALVVRFQKYPDIDWEFVIGDILTDLRFTLDYLAYQLVIAHTGQDPPPDANRIEFPIYLDPARYGERDNRGQPTRNSGLARVAQMSPKAQTYIESVQPYNGGKNGNWLWTLHEFCNINKHRFIPPTLTTLEVSASVDNATLAELIPNKIDRLKDGDIVARVRLAQGPVGAIVSINGTLSTGVVLNPGPSMASVPLEDMSGFAYGTRMIYEALRSEVEP